MPMLRRAAACLSLSALVVAGLAPAAQADNLDADTLVPGVASFGDVCRGTTASGGVPFTLRRTGNVNQSWGNSALVTVAPMSQPSPLTLGSTSGTTTATWVAGANNVEVSAGSAAASVSVPANATPGARSAAVTYAATGAGAGGGTTTRDRLVTFSWNVVDCAPADTTAPVISRVLTPAAPDGANGWYRTNVSVDWTVSDPESSAALQGCADTALTTDGSLTTSCSATSSGGSAGPVGVTVKRDATPPLLEPSVSGELGSDGWYTGDVTVSWLASDATSQIDPETLCAPASLAEDVTSRSFSCTVRDLAGNATSTSVTLKRDATDPVVVSHVAGTLGGSGWFTSNVDVTWTVSDATSDLAGTTGCGAATLDHDSASTSYTCSATDNAGNSTSATVSVKRDATAPDVAFTRAGLEGDNGWYRGPVTLDWTVADTLSGLTDVQGCVDTTVTADGRHVLPCTATDAAGNTAVGTAIIDKDATAPVVIVSLAGDEGDNGWYVGDVQVGWMVTDATSGVAGRTGCDPSSLTADSAGSSYTCSATDLAGNTGSDTETVKRDATAPVLAVTGGPADGATYSFGDVPAASTCSATDATSGLTGPCTVTAGGTAVGPGKQVATATDHAGNVATQTRTYTVAAWRLDGFYKPVTMGGTVVNTVKAGSTVPLKFNVVKGGAVMTAGIGASFVAKKVGCDGADVATAVDEFGTTGSTTLRYDGAGGQWVQNWATPASGKGSCYRVTMTTADGSTVSADFSLK